MTKERHRFQFHILRASLSFFIVLVLSLSLPLSARAYVSGIVGIKDGVFNGTTYLPSSTFTVGYDGIQLLDGSSKVSRGSGYWQIDFPVFKVVNLDGFGSYANSYDDFYFLLNQFVDLRMSVSSPASPSALRVYNVQSEIVYVFDGKEHVTVSNITTRLPLPFLSDYLSIFLRVKLSYDYNYTTSTSSPAMPVGYIAFTPSVSINNSNLYGRKIVTTGEKLVADGIASLSTWLNTMLNSIFNKIGAESSAIQNKIQAQINNDNANTKSITDKIAAQITNDNTNTNKIINSANTNSQNEINAANKNSQNEIAAANKNADDIMHDYDTTKQDSDNQKFDDAQKELQEVEDNLFGQAVSGFSDLNMADYTIGKFSAVLGAFSFVSNFIQSLYVKMDDFGTIVTIGLVVMIATKVIGVYRFSTGGDSS